jgi:hypothetical protein
MSTVRDQIVVALVAALGAAGPVAGHTRPAGLTVHRERTRPIEVDSLPAVLVYFEDDIPRPFDAQKFRSPFLERDLGVALECRAQGSQAVPVDVALDPILVWALAAGFIDETFGGLALGAIEGRTEWKSREGDVPVAAATLHISIKFRTSRLDPTSSPTHS